MKHDHITKPDAADKFTLHAIECWTGHRRCSRNRKHVPPGTAALACFAAGLVAVIFGTLFLL